MAAILKLRQIEKPAIFDPDTVWNDGALSFLKRSPEQEEQQDE